MTRDRINTLAGAFWNILAACLLTAVIVGAISFAGMW